MNHTHYEIHDKSGLRYQGKSLDEIDEQLAKLEDGAYAVIRITRLREVVIETPPPKARISVNSTMTRGPRKSKATSQEAK